jgi:hypothetical protein
VSFPDVTDSRVLPALRPADFHISFLSTHCTYFSPFHLPSYSVRTYYSLTYLYPMPYVHYLTTPSRIPPPTLTLTLDPGPYPTHISISYRSDNIPAMQSQIPKLRDRLGSDAQYFNAVYAHTFQFARSEGQRSLGEFSFFLLSLLFVFYFLLFLAPPPPPPPSVFSRLFFSNHDQTYLAALLSPWPFSSYLLIIFQHGARC